MSSHAVARIRRAFRAALACALLTGSLNQAFADGTVTGHGRFERIKGHPSAGYAELYECNLFLSPYSSPPIGPSCRLGAPPGVPPTHDGYYITTVPAGTYSILVNQPLFFVRPKVRPNVIVQNNQTTTADVELAIDYSTYFRDNNQWTWPDTYWYQTYTATGTSVTGVVFVVADSDSTGAEVAILRDNGNPDVRYWQLVGSRSMSNPGAITDNWVRWRSGEIPTVPGTRYAVRIGVTGGDNKLQPFKRNHDANSYGPSKGRAYNSAGQPQDFDLNYIVFADNDGTRVTMNKRTGGVGNLQDGNFRDRWGHTFTAGGTGLAGVDVWAAGAEHKWNIDFTWTIRENGPTGRPIGPVKTTQAAYQAFGVGLHGASYNPGEVPLVAGRTYFIEFAALNPPPESPGFNPYVMDYDSYGGGMPYRYEGNNVWTAMPGIDLSMTIVEYTTPITQPVISVDPQAFTHSVIRLDPIPDDTFTIKNIGAGTLNYTVTEYSPWLSVSPTSGSSTGELDTITISYDSAQLLVGTNVATISINDPNATNHPQTVTVTVNVAQQPARIVCSTTAVSSQSNAGTTAPRNTFTVANGGDGSMSYAVTDDQPWMWVTPETGVSSGEADVINVNYNTASLAPGTYAGTIRVASAQAVNSPQFVAVTLKVYPAADFDQDEDADLSDFGFFQACFNGPNRSYALPECHLADFDNDADVDLNDFGFFQACFNGPNRPVTAACLQ